MPSVAADEEVGPPARDAAWTVFKVFLRLGLTSFGGPVAHLGYFRDAFVVRRRWIGERAYADLVALCQFLPGPASSQVGMAIGWSRGGWTTALAAWAGFTMPSALLLVLFAQGLSAGGALPPGVLHGLKVVAVAVVAQAVWGMARQLCTDTARVILAVASACAVLRWPQASGQIGVIAAAAVVGLLLFRPGDEPAHDPLLVRVGRRTGLVLLGVFFGLLLGLPVAARVWPDPVLAIVAVFYRAGALVFGGGHVVLPLLHAAVVPAGWVTNETFLAGYGAAQAVPGPLFTFAAFLGAAMQGPAGGWLGGAVALAAVFLPSLLLVIGALPFWEGLRRGRRSRAALAGVNAAVVGLLLAALGQTVAAGALAGPADVGLALVALLALMAWKLPPWLVVLGCGAAGMALALAFPS